MEAAALNPPPPLGRVLVECGLLTEDQVTQALEEQQRSGRKLGEILVSSGVVSGPAIANALAEQRGTVIKTEYGFGTGLASRRRPVEAVPPPPLDAPPPAPLPAPEKPDRVAELEADVVAREARIAELQAELARRATKAETLHARISELEQELAAGPEPVSAEAGEYVLVLPAAAGYRLVARHGSVPPLGSRISVRGSIFTTARVGASPLRDGRPAVFLD